MREMSDTRDGRQQQHNSPDPQAAADARQEYYLALYDATH